MSDQQQQKAQNPGVTSYNPDAIESVMFAAAAGLLVGACNGELVGFALERNSPSTSFFFEPLDQTARCVCICPVERPATSSSSTGAASSKKEWLVAVGGDAKFVDVFRVTFDNHVSACHGVGRIGPFPKRVQSLTVLHAAKEIVLVADRFGDVYQCFLTQDAQTPLMRRSSSSVVAAAANNNNGGAAAAVHNQQVQVQQDATVFDSEAEHPYMRFALQHLGLISVMRPVEHRAAAAAQPWNNNAGASPLLVTCDSDAHVRVSDARRPGLLLASLWKEYFASEEDGSEDAANAASKNGGGGSNADVDPHGSGAGPTVGCVDAFDQPDARSPTLLVGGRCDGTLSAWALQRRDLEQLDVVGTATCDSFGSAPVVGVACLSLSSTFRVVVFAKADSAKLYGWVPSLSATDAHGHPTGSGNSAGTRRAAPDSSNRNKQQHCFTISSSGNHTAQHHLQQQQTPTKAAAAAAQQQALSALPPLVALFPCPSVGHDVCLAVFRDSSVVLFQIDVVPMEAAPVPEGGGCTPSAAVKLVCRALPFPSSSSHLKVPLPFSSQTKAVVHKVRMDSHYAIVAQAKVEHQKRFEENKRAKMDAAAAAAAGGGGGAEDAE